MDQDTYDSMIHKRDDVDYSWEKRVSIVNDIRNFIFGLAGATVYGFCKSRKQKFVMSFTISIQLTM